MTKPIVEQHIEEAAIEILQELGYDYIYSPNIDPNSKTPLREKWDDVILDDKLRDFQRLLCFNSLNRRKTSWSQNVTTLNRPNFLIVN